MKTSYPTFMLLHSVWHQAMSRNCIRAALDARASGEPNGWWLGRARALAGVAREHLREWRELTFTA